MSSEDLVPFRIDVPEADLADLADRLGRTRWPDPETVDDWSQGIPLAYTRALADHWATAYDWREREARLNAFPQYRTELDGLGIHLVHVPSPEPGALPLLLTHGWPGSWLEFTEVIGPLTDPAAHGGDPADAFHVVCPSLPGFAWSDKPTAPGWGVPRIARAWATLMARLGYDRYGAQGGDWGSFVTTALGQADPDHLAGIHLNLVLAAPDGDQTSFNDDEVARLTAADAHRRDGTGYSKQQSTRPQTLGYGLADSPVGQMAWIVEKFWNWTDTGGDPVAALGADRLLDNVMSYWLTDSGASSARLYWESFRDRGQGTVDVPMGAAVFPREIYRPTRAWAERQYTDIRRWSEPDVGGHFAAVEQPALFVDEVRAFFRLVR